MLLELFCISIHMDYYHYRHRCQLWGEGDRDSLSLNAKCVKNLCPRLLNDTRVTLSINETRDCRHILHIKPLRIDCLLLPPLSVHHFSPHEPTKSRAFVGVTIQYVGVSLRAYKSGTIRGLRGWRAGRRVKALISVPSRPDRDG